MKKHPNECPNCKSNRRKLRLFVYPKKLSSVLMGARGWECNDDWHLTSHQFEWKSEVPDRVCACNHSLLDHALLNPTVCSHVNNNKEGKPISMCHCQDFVQIKAMPLGATVKEVREILIEALEKKIVEGFKEKLHGYTPTGRISKNFLNTNPYGWF